MKKSSKKINLKCAPVALACAFTCQAIWAQTTDLGTVKIASEGEFGTGMVIDEDGAKIRSSVTREAIEKQRPSSNPFQLLNLLPGVNASSHDATGLFGGNLRVRGFNSDQMGLTINGAPVNDSGNFAVYPQEYTDSENLCELFITQGSADTDAPHVGASGGNIGILSCGPNDQFGGKFSQSIGGLSFNKTFIRLDSGLFGEKNPSKTFISLSNSTVDKFKGFGGAKREHIDWGWDTKISKDTSFNASLLYNRAVNNNFLSVTKNEFNNNPKLDYTNVIPQHSTASPMTDSSVSNFGTSSVSSTPRSKLAYYGYSLNPFENALLTSRLKTRVNEQLTLSAEPYYWYGYGTGGTQQTSLTEVASSATALKYGIGNVSNSGSALNDSVGVYRGSVTETHRPGFTVKAAYDIEDHKILAGYWYERAIHRQTQPATTLGNDGSIGDLWLKTGLLTYNNGELYQGRNWKTISTGSSVFVSDTYTQGKLDIIPGVRYTTIQRNFNNYASSGTGGGADYQAEATYSKLLPSFGIRYRLDDETQVFGNVTENMRAPSNFVLSGWVSTTGASISNGAWTGYTLKPNTSIKVETATNSEIGVRFNKEYYKASVAFFNVDFKNRIAQGFNPDTATYTDYNVGNSNMKGLQAEIGTKPIKGLSFYGSMTYTNSKILDNFPATSSTTLPTSGSVFPDTPKIMWAASAQYTTGSWLAMLSAKYTGKRYTTLVNDEYLDAYTVYDLNAGYKFESSAFFKNPTLRLSVSNLFNKSYLIANSGSGSNITTSTTAVSSQGGGFPTYYVGAPRFTSLTLSTDF